MATNPIDILDSALPRPGRIDRYEPDIISRNRIHRNQCLKSGFKTFWQRYTDSQILIQGRQNVNQTLKRKKMMFLKHKSELLKNFIIS